MITVDDIVKCEKVITKKRKPEFQSEYRHYRINIELQSIDLDIKLIMFLRKSKDSPNKDFSIGLRAVSPNFFANHDTVIVRFQGPHGGQSSTKQLTDLHNNYHIHLYTEDDRTHHRKAATYKGAGNFNSFEQALAEFLLYCNIQDPNGIFDDEVAMSQQFELDLDNL